MSDYHKPGLKTTATGSEYWSQSWSTPHKLFGGEEIQELKKIVKKKVL